MTTPARQTDGRSARRCEHVRRAIAILLQLRAGGSYRLARLAKDHGVCERTIRRDLSVLESAGVAIGHSERGEEFSGRWWVAGRKWL